MADNQSNPAVAKPASDESAKKPQPSAAASAAQEAPAANAAQKPAEKPKPKPKAAAKPAPKPKPPADPIYAPARPARRQRRHWLLLLSFLICVILPSFLTGSYLWTRAVDQFTSSVGFTVRREDAPTAVDLLGGLGAFSGASSSDSDILFEFIQSQELVERVDRTLDLRGLYSRHRGIDPIFSLSADSSIEDLVDYWQRMVLISYAPGTGLIELKVLAFTPEEAREIAREIFKESSEMINMLSAIAREDATRYAREELDVAVAQLKEARQALTAFRSRTQIVDPSADIQLQMGLLTTLQQQLGTELIDYDLLLTSVKEGDPRLQKSEQRIAAIRARISEEREKFGGGEAVNGEGYATLVAEFERLSVDREFTEQKYTAALSNFDAAQAQAQRQSRYLAAYLNPTLAESAEYPRRFLLLGLTVLFLLIGWSTSALIYYSLRDRR
ncbi:putative polysaccharide export-assoiated protein [Roseobacter sp. SK209-2-6]|uniref:sugar transporter n=1 Tax=Roseobacter sp. SK209-2-6 TaxID=388739 RepID=UPI0000F3F1F5|nr:sugar transporter [Roseobacter sp. SK209-2-6]EBA14534.1 putative polysaccharide export-assoiated protein [Roseobacter sp. SK209-2-6]